MTDENNNLIDGLEFIKVLTVLIDSDNIDNDDFRNVVRSLLRKVNLGIKKENE